MTLNSRDVYGLVDGQKIWSEVLSNLCKATGGFWIYSDTVADNNYLRVTQNGTPSMDIDVQVGKFMNKNSGVEGIESYAGGTHAISNGDATHPRYDLVILIPGDGGASPTVIDVIQGTPAAVPNPPTTIGSDNFALGLVCVAANESTSITNDVITDLRILRYSATP